MARPHPFNLIYQLEIGEHLLVEPKPDETLESAIKRIKLRLSKYRKDERSYFTTLDGAAIRIERVPFGLNSKYWPWIKLRQGERMLVCDGATEADVRRVQQSIQFLDKGARYEKSWEWRREKGSLYVQCVFDANHERKTKVPVELTREQILRRNIRIEQGGIDLMKRSGGSEGTRAWLDEKCSLAEERIVLMRHELEALEAKPPIGPVPR